MLSLHRARGNDPIHQLDSRNLRFGRRLETSLDEDYAELACDINALQDKIPNYDERRAIMSRCPLASVDGFWATVLLVCEYVLGMRVCAQSPHCNHTRTCSSQDSYLVHC